MTTRTIARPLTFTAAKAACRELGYTLRKELPGESGLVLYPLGTGADAPDSYFTDCPADALATCKAMATPFDVATAERNGGPYAKAMSGDADCRAELAALCCKASTPALESAARALIYRAAVANGAERASITGRLVIVCDALAARQAIGAAPLWDNATPAEQARVAARREELAAAFALPAARPAAYDVHTMTTPGAV